MATITKGGNSLLFVCRQIHREVKGYLDETTHTLLLRGDVKPVDLYSIYDSIRAITKIELDVHLFDTMRGNVYKARARGSAAGWVYVVEPTTFPNLEMVSIRHVRTVPDTHDFCHRRPDEMLDIMRTVFCNEELEAVYYGPSLCGSCKRYKTG